MKDEATERYRDATLAVDAARQKMDDAYVAADAALAAWKEARLEERRAKKALLQSAKAAKP